MFLKGIKRKLAQKYISKHSDATREINQNKIKTLGVLVDATLFHEFPFINDLSKLFNVSKSEISLLYYHPSTKQAKEMNVPVFTSNALAFGGQIKGEVVENFVNQKFDALLNFHEGQQLLLNLVSVHSKAKFKIGFSEANTKLNDFTVVTAIKNIETIRTELKKYLSILNKI